MLKITLQAPFLNVQMTFEQRSSSLVLHQMTSDHNRLELGIHDHNNEPSSSKLVPKVVPLAVKTATSRQELELLFHHHIAMLRTTVPTKIELEHWNKSQQDVSNGRPDPVKQCTTHSFSAIRVSLSTETYSFVTRDTQVSIDISAPNVDIELGGNMLQPPTFKIMQKSEHVGQRHNIARWQILKCVNDKGLKVKIAKHEETTYKTIDKRPEHSIFNDKINHTDLMKSVINELTSGEIGYLKFIESDTGSSFPAPCVSNSEREKEKRESFGFVMGPLLSEGIVSLKFIESNKEARSLYDGASVFN
ncbi:hypothetical protein Tco_1273691 [Tanacetum coccineum]